MTSHMSKRGNQRRWSLFLYALSSSQKLDSTFCCFFETDRPSPNWPPAVCYLPSAPYGYGSDTWGRMSWDSRKWCL